MLTSPAAGLPFICPRQHVITVINAKKDVVNYPSRIRQDSGMNAPDDGTNCMFQTMRLSAVEAACRTHRMPAASLAVWQTKSIFLAGTSIQKIGGPDV
jgi:hypothetical protein